MFNKNYVYGVFIGLSCLISSSTFNYSQTRLKPKQVLFYFDDKNQDHFSTTTFSVQEISLNKKVIAKIKQKFTGDFSIETNEKGENEISGSYSLYKKSDKSATYKLKEKVTTKYIRYKNGSLKIAPQYFYPVLRNIPMFPRKKVVLNESWAGDTYISQNLKKIGFKKPVLLKAKTRYRYLKNVNYKNHPCAIIYAYFIVNQNNKKPIGKAYKKFLSSEQGDYISRWMGLYKGNYYYSFKTKSIIHFKAEYSYLFLYENGSIHEINGKDIGDITKTKLNNKGK